jgi:hypothetical protein
MSRPNWEPVAAVAALALAGIAAGCTLLTSRTGLQCQLSADCWAKGGAFTSTICTAQGTCAPVSAGDASATLGCVSSSQCEFAFGGAAARCIDDACVKVVQPGCVALGPVSEDTAVLFGILVPLQGLAAGQLEILGQAPASFFNGVLNDFNTLGGADAGGTTRYPHFGAVVCDEASLDSATALFKTLKVPFIVGPASEASLQTVLTDKARTYTVISPLGDNAIYANPTQEDPNKRQWFIDLNRSNGTNAFASMVSSVSQLTAQKRYPTDAATPGPIKLAFVYDSLEPNEQNFASTLVPLLTVNGSPAMGNSSYLGVDVHESVTDPSAAVTLPATDVTAFAPDVVVIAGALWAAPFINLVESRWAVLFHTPPPIYVMWRVLPTLASFAQLNHWPAQRAFALDAYRDSNVETTGAVTLERFSSAELMSGMVPPPYGLTNYSDALYSGFYGVTAGAGGGSGIGITSDQLATGLTNVSQGSTDVQLVAAQIVEMLGLIRSGTQTRMVGGTGYLGFNPALGVPVPGVGQASTPQGFAAYCISSSTASSPYQLGAAGVSYAASNQQPSGNLDCP